MIELTVMFLIEIFSMQKRVQQPRVFVHPNFVEVKREENYIEGVEMKEEPISEENNEEEKQDPSKESPLKKNNKVSPKSNVKNCK